MKSEYPLWVVCRPDGSAVESTVREFGISSIQQFLHHYLDGHHEWPELADGGYTVRRCRIEVEPEVRDAK